MRNRHNCLMPRSVANPGLEVDGLTSWYTNTQEHEPGVDNFPCKQNTVKIDCTEQEAGDLQSLRTPNTSLIVYFTAWFDAPTSCERRCFTNATSVTFSHLTSSGKSEMQKYRIAAATQVNRPSEGYYQKKHINQRPVNETGTPRMKIHLHA